MNDQAVWDTAVATAKAWYFDQQPGVKQNLDNLIDEIMRFKQDLVELVASAGSLEICRTCGGECCRHGKYYVSTLDILAYLKNGSKQVVPDFSTDPYCPYSSASGCMMPPPYRPMTCTVFNCQLIEDQLTADERDKLQISEKKLREAITKAGHIIGVRLDRSLLLSCS